MSASLPDFNRGAVRPMECLKTGWGLIKGDYWLFLGITLVGVLIGSVVPMGIMMGPMMCGIYFCLLSRLRGERVEFGGLFKGFDFFGDSIIAALAQMLPIMAMLVPLYIVMMIGMATLTPEKGAGRAQDYDPSPLITFLIAMAVVFVVFFLVSMAVSALFMFSYPLIIDKRLSGFNAIKTSAKAVMANLGGVLGLMTLNVLLGILGVLFCYVGAVFVMPIGLAAWAIAYRQVFPASQT